MVERGRAGRVGLGCLLTLTLVGVVVYYGAGVARVYWNYYEFRDSMRQTAGFADRLSNREIAMQLRSVADSLGLPAAARRVRVSRTARGIRIWSEYTDTLRLPLAARPVSFSPRVSRVF